MLNLEFFKYFDVKIIRYSFYFKIIIISFLFSTLYHISKLEISTIILNFILIFILYNKLIKADFINILKHAQVINKEATNIEDLISNLKNYNQKLQGLSFIFPFLFGFFVMDAIISFFKML
jgi:hypothetical protein